MCMTCEIRKYLLRTGLRQNDDCELYAVINRISYKEGKMNGSTMSGICPLNYCPECGKQLKRGIKAYLESEEQ